MKSIRKHAYVFVTVLAVAGLLFLAVPKAMAQQDGGSDADDKFNPPPCDFSNQFYADNGIDVNQLIGRFGSARQFGPPANGNQANWVADEDNCFEKDPTRRDFRILATTGGNADDGNSQFTNGTPETVEFISILAFLNSQGPFLQTPPTRTVGFINGGLQGVQQNPGIQLSIGDATLGEAPGQTLRGFAMQDIVSNFEAYASISQTGKSLNCPANATAPFTSQNCQPTSKFANNPCSLQMIQQLQNPAAASIPQPCFEVADEPTKNGPLSDVATPNLRQNWRFATNRNAMDGSDGNNPFAASPNSAPFGYFCDDLLGMWIITYFWMTRPPNDAECGPVYQSIGAQNGFNLDGGPIILTATELNVFLEGHTPDACGSEGKEDMAGGDGGAVFLICPGLPDPRAGAITSDAFLDVVRLPNGNPQDPVVAAAFSCLQKTGKFCNE
jgi:hypothetical protein